MNICLHFGEKHKVTNERDIEMEEEEEEMLGNQVEIIIMNVNNQFNVINRFRNRKFDFCVCFFPYLILVVIPPWSY